MEIPFLPISINALYYNNIFGGGRTLSKEGRVFETRVKDYIVDNYFHQLSTLNAKSPFAIDIKYFLPIEDLFTKNYGKKKGAKSPYKRRDLGNLEKLTIDCIKGFFMEDDCQIFSESLLKFPSSTFRGMHIIVTELNTSEITSYLEKIDAVLIKENIERYKLDDGIRIIK